MHFDQFRRDERAVPPVIGIVLLVALTVLIALVVGTYVFGLTGQISDDSPSVSYSGEFTEVDLDGERIDAFTITHESGDVVNEGQVEVVVNGETAWGIDDNEAIGVWDGDDDVGAGDAITIVAASNDVQSGDEYDYDGELNTNSATDVGIELGDRVRIFWTAEDGETSATLLDRRID